MATTINFSGGGMVTTLLGTVSTIPDDSRLVITGTESYAEYDLLQFEFKYSNYQLQAFINPKNITISAVYLIASLPNIGELRLIFNDSAILTTQYHSYFSNLKVYGIKF